MADTVRAFRLVKAQFAPGLDGEGAKKAPGRWNPRGVPVVYCASSASLAVLETFVHLPAQMRRSSALPPLVIVSLDIDPAYITTLSATTDDSLASRRALGATWLSSCSSVGAWVPSQVVPLDRNLLLNPLHPDFDDAVQRIDQRAFEYDPRMMR